MRLFRNTRLFPVAVVAFIAGLAVSCASLERSRTVVLFDGKSLEGWQHVLADASVPRAQVWSVQDGILKCKGEPFGALYRGPEVTNFKMEVEYRWAPGKKPGNSGIFSRIERPVTFLPRAIEVQLQHGNAGDVMGLQGKNIAGAQARFLSIKAHPVAGDITGVAKIEDAERPAGEWNNVVVEARGPVYTVHINGKLVNRAEGVDVTAGPVGVQSEGGEIHFRKIVLTPLE